jgi:hypothetical protein
MNSGWALLLEREDPRRLHQMAEHYGTTQRQNGFVACSLCPDAPPAARPLAVGVVMS